MHPASATSGVCSTARKRGQLLWRSDGEIRWQFLIRRTAVFAAIRPRVADVPSRHRLRSSTSDDLIVLAVRLTSIGSRAFPAAGARIWNTLPLHVTSASSLTVFKQRLKLHLFCFSFPGLSPI